MFHINDGLLSYLFSGETPIIAERFYYPLVIATLVLVIAASYLLGSINSSIVFSKLFYGDDIRNHGSGNAGLTNMFRTYGKGAAGLTLLGDILKTFIAVFLAGTLFGFGYVAGVSCGGLGLCYVAGLFVVLGHVFPCFYKFKGGKGVLATAAMALMLSPVVFLILLLIFIAVVAVSKYISLGSVTVAILYPVVLYGYFAVCFPERGIPAFAALATIILAILIVWCHRGNLQRISTRTERKFSFRKKSEDDE